MPTTDTPEIGDGVVTIVIPDEGKKTMAMDLPDGVGQLMMTESAGNIQASNRNTRGVFMLTRIKTDSRDTPSARKSYVLRCAE